MFHYNGRPISKQEMTEILADREAAIILARAKREREKDEDAVRLARREVICAGIVVFVAASLILTFVSEVLW